MKLSNAFSLFAAVVSLVSLATTNGGAVEETALALVVKNEGRKLELECEDDSDFTIVKKGKEVVGCDFVADKPAKRCRKKFDGIKARHVCQNTCRRFSKEKCAIKPASIEGEYSYFNKCGNIFLASITCGDFDGDKDLCLYAEYSLGNIVEEEVAGSEPLDNGGFLVFDEAANKDSVDPNEVCIFSGTFSKSSRVKNGKLLPTPLAVSSACQTRSEDGLIDNFRLVVKADINDDGTLIFDFSQDFGETYTSRASTDCPNAYIGQPVEVDRRALSTDQHHHGRKLILPLLIPLLIAAVPTLMCVLFCELE